MKRSGAIGNEVAVTRRHIGEYDANRRLDIRDIRKITKGLILVNNEVSTKFGGVAQLGEHLPCKQGVRSSILLISTKGRRKNEQLEVSQYCGVAKQQGDFKSLAILSRYAKHNGRIAQVVRAHA